MEVAMRAINPTATSVEVEPFEPDGIFVMCRLVNGRVISTVAHRHSRLPDDELALSKRILREVIKFAQSAMLAQNPNGLTEKEVYRSLDGIRFQKYGTGCTWGKTARQFFFEHYKERDQKICLAQVMQLHASQGARIAEWQPQPYLENITTHPLLSKGKDEVVKTPEDEFWVKFLKNPKRRSEAREMKWERNGDPVD